MLRFNRIERVYYTDTDGVEFAYDNFIFHDENDDPWEIRSIIYNVASSDYPELTIGSIKIMDEARTWGELTPEDLSSRFNDACERFYREMW
ncbi:hypothetical protein Cri9333_5002 (plasmid) [Crinalium epipsammum PCC 9333]|uniref:Uncharacterized protein n=1 Tax=Crinalium epipsammum PCC 9333 TaxID=1173022 RepID=K9W7P6_9CYAN|nr:hypothetical protein Cri9333_5002 [Crinalium epipsammum PCC 9333]